MFFPFRKSDYLIFRNLARKGPVRVKHVLVLLLTLFFAAPLSAETFPEHTEDTVYDFAQVLSPADETHLRAMTEELLQVRGTALVVVTIGSMQDYGWSGEIEPYATRLFNAWGIGSATENDGVLILVAVKDRQMRIELGDGYTFITSWQAQGVINKQILPAFKQDRYVEGILEGTREMVYVVSGDYPGELLAKTHRQSPGAFLLRFVVGAGVVLALLVSSFLVYLKRIGFNPLERASRSVQRDLRTEARRCPVDGSAMELIAEDWEDKYLKDGQKAEQRVGSVDYVVWKCKQCPHVTIQAQDAWFHNITACDKCGFKTLEAEEHIVTSATSTEPGVAEVDYHCVNCGARHSEMRTIQPRSGSNLAKYAQAIDESNDSMWVRSGQSSFDGGFSSGPPRSPFGGGRSSGKGSSGRW